MLIRATKLGSVPRIRTPKTPRRNGESAIMVAERSYADANMLGAAVSITRDFYRFDEFIAFAESNPMFFDDEVEKNIIRHCQICGIQSRALGYCSPSDIAIIGPESREHVMARGLNSRQRAVLEELYSFLESRSLTDEYARIYGHEAITPLALFMRGHFPRYLGTEFARNEAEKSKLFPIPHGDICQSEFESASFDAIVSCDVLEHVQSLDDALRESARILVEGGRLIATLLLSS